LASPEVEVQLAEARAQPLALEQDLRIEERVRAAQVERLVAAPPHQLRVPVDVARRQGEQECCQQVEALGDEPAQPAVAAGDAPPLRHFRTPLLPPPQ